MLPSIGLRLLTSLVLLLATPDAGAQGFVDHTELDPLPEPAPNGFGGGVAFYDADGDGWEDLLVGHLQNGVFLYRNGGPPDFDFTNVTPDVGLPGGMTGAVGGAASDLDRDGDMDLVVLDYKHLRLFTWTDGRYEETTDRALPGLPWFPSTVSFADVDGDGWTDLYVSGYTLVLDWPYHECAPDMLLRNRGDGTFEDVAAAAGTDDRGCGLTGLFSDYDRDGDVDLFTGNDFGMFASPNHLFENEGISADGSVSFVDVSEESGADRRLYGMGLTTADVNDDGWPDYFGTSIGRDVLLLGAASGVFEDATERYGVTSALGIDGWRVTWGCRFLDVENDGFWDLHVASGFLGAAPEITNDPVQPSLLFTHLDGASPSQDEASDLGIAPDDASRGVAVCDFDDDGDDDVATAAIGGAVHVYRNDVGAGPALRVHLHGTVSTPEAYGAWLRLECDGVRREREVVVGGALASASSPVMRMPLAGCESGGTLFVDWPSGARTAVEVAGDGERLDLVEPRWIETTPEVAPADGIAPVTVRVTPRADDGSLLGAGHAVTLSATGGAVSAVSDLGDGSYETELVSDTPGGVALSIAIDGVAMVAHPRVAFFPAGEDATTVHVSPETFVAHETDVVVTVVPRGADGALDGPGRAVSFVLQGATLEGAVTDHGEGSYSATLRGEGGTAFRARAVVDGLARGPFGEATEIPAIDPDRSVVRLAVGWVNEADVEDDTETSIQVSPRNGIGNTRPDTDALAYEIRGPGGDVPIQSIGNRSGGVSLRVLSQDVLAECPCELFVDGVRLPRAIALSTWADESQLRDAVDPEKSRIGPYLEAAYADGQDYAAVQVELRDAEGDGIPMTDRFSWSSDAMTLLESRTLSERIEGKARLRAGVVSGPAAVAVTFDGAPIGVETRVDLVAPPPRDPETDRVRTCLAPVVPAGGLDVVDVVVSPIDENDFLVGSGYPLAAYADGVEIPLDYSEPGEYHASVPTPKDPALVTVQTEMLGTGRGSTLVIEFFDPTGMPEDRDRPPCAEIADGFVRVDPGTDAGPDAGDDGGGADADAGTDGGTPRPRGDGCGCRATGEAPPARGGAGSWLLAIVGIGVMARRRVRSYPRSSRRGT